MIKINKDYKTIVPTLKKPRSEVGNIYVKARQKIIITKALNKHKIDIRI